MRTPTLDNQTATRDSEYEAIRRGLAEIEYSRTGSHRLFWGPAEQVEPEDDSSSSNSGTDDDAMMMVTPITTEKT